MEEFDTREKEKCRATGDVFLTGGFPIEDKSGLPKEKLHVRPQDKKKKC